MYGYAVECLGYANIYLYSIFKSIMQIPQDKKLWKIMSLSGCDLPICFILQYYILGVDRYVFFRADTDTDYYRSSRPITDILNRYTCLV